MTIELQLLGGFGASREGRPIEGLRAPGPSRLLAFLALHRHTRPRRMYLAALFWPDGSDLRARRRLSHNLWVLQTALAPVDASLVQADRDSIGLHPDADLWIDAEEFEEEIDAYEVHRRDGSAHLHSETLSRTLQLYQGDLLSDHYDEWIDPIRLRLREKYLLGLRHLVQVQKARGEYSAALVSARELVSETPLAEQAHAELMRLYWMSGRADEALAQYEACRQILSDELGVSPSDELIALEARVLAHRRPTSAGGQTLPASAGTPPVSTDQHVLVGRAEERRRVLDVVDAAFGGSGSLALIEGHAGMGKSQLLSNVAEAARWRGACVVSARHTSPRQLEPYDALGRALSAALKGLRREQVLARLAPDVIELAGRALPGLDDVLPTHRADIWRSPEERWRLQAALTDVVLALGTITPTALLLDDLQWCDRETLEFLRLAAPRFEGTQVSVILSYRTHEGRNRDDVWQLLTDLEMRHSVTRVELKGLAVEDIAALAQICSSHPVPDTLIDELERATGGNPLFVMETVRAIDRASSEGTRAALLADRASGHPIVERVIEVLVGELDTASPNVQTLVGALAIWGGPASSGDLSRLTHLEVRETLDAIREGVAAEFIAERDGRFELRFEQLAEAARARLSLAEEQAFHLRTAELRSEDPLVPASELAAHYREAGRWSEAARFEASAAARAAGLHAYETAVRHYELALESLDAAGERPSMGLLFGFEDVLDTLGRRDEQAKIIEVLDAAPNPTVLNRIRILERRSMHLANTDRFTEALQTGAEAVGFAVASEIAVTPYLVSLARVLIMAGYPDLARRHLEGLVGEGGDAVGLARAHLVLGQALTDTQDLEGADQQLMAALELFRREGDTRGQVDALAAIAVLESQTGDTVAALRHYHEAIALARQIGNRFGEGMALANLGLLQYIVGNAAAALSDLQDAIEVFIDIDHRRGEAMVRANSASILHNIVGDDILAEHEATLGRRYFEEIGDARHTAQCLDVLGGIRRRKRAYAIARKLLTTALQMVRSTGDPWLEIQIARSLAWTELDAGRAADALSVLEQTITVAEDHAATLELPSLLGLKGLAHLTLDQHDAALRSATRSAEVSSRGSELQHVAGWWRYEVFEALGHDQTAEAELASAHALLVDLLAPFEQSDRDASLARVAVHKKLAAAYASRFPRTQRVVLAPEGAPSAPPSIELEWTVHHPDDLCIKDKKERRQRRLLRILGEAHLHGAHARIEDLAQALDASTSTLKRDLAALRAEGELP